jgi:ribosomal protein S18 acetylase RimI-like enzyme
VNPLSNCDPALDGLSSHLRACRLVKPHEVVAALRMVLGTDGHPAEESQAVDLMKYTAQRGINLADIWIYEANGWLRWAALPVVSPGRTVLYFGAIASVVGHQLEPMQAGIHAISAYFAAKNIQLAQVLLDPADTASINVYLKSGFQRIAELIYLQRTVRRIAYPAPLPGNFQIESYSDKNHTEFGKTVLASYENSLDCPPLNGIRNIEDILAGHKAAGIFDPRDWMLLRRDDEPIAVLLLSKTHQGDAMELVYLGLVPEARGHGLANHLMQVAEARVCARKIRKFSLAVDAKNAPALKLYYKHGMAKITTKVAMMRMLAP